MVAARSGRLIALSILGFCLWDCALARATWAKDGIFEVRAVSVDSTFYRHGKVERDKPGDEVVYQVNIPAKTITRMAVYNKNIPGHSLGGLQSDNTIYQIVLNTQHLIKAIGQTGIDGYETIVIGDDFVTTSRSTLDYFVLFSYKRTDLAGERSKEARYWGFQKEWTVFPMSGSVHYFRKGQ